MGEYGYILLGITLLIILCIVLYQILKNRFKKFESLEFDLDISGKKSKTEADYIDMVIIQNQDIVDKCDKRIADYEEYIESMRQKYIKKKYRLRQIDKVYKTLSKKITIHVYRTQTRYQQVNYVKTAYKVDCEVDVVEISLIKLRKIYFELKELNFELTRSETFRKDQRKLMTPEIRRKVKIRDNYTCQCCGKYMPDEVGLHIDHIVPISRGGLTVTANLQVLCDKCNLKKRNKFI